MQFNRLWRRAPLAALAPLAVLVATATAQADVTLSGYVYIDRNNDGALTFNDQPDPEFVIPGVTIELFSIVGLIETLVDSTVTNDVGFYEFDALPPGEFALRQIQPAEYVDGLSTPGSVRDLIGNLNPAGSDPGIALANAITNIEMPDDTRGVLFNFGERGLSAAYVSKRFLLGTAPPLPTVAIPEPATGALAAVAAIGALAGMRRRRD
jgi:MYXO-CTERM domain-containing protein